MNRHPRNPITASKLALGAQGSGAARPPAARKEGFDLIVVGGGVAGTCAAIAANRLGLRVLLLQDREMLGGCNSSEVRVAMGGILGKVLGGKK